MIILKDIPFQKMAKFLHENVCEIVPQTPHRDGFKDFLELLKEIYADTASYETNDKLASYARLMNPIWFLYGCFKVGEVNQVDGNMIEVNKSKLLKTYKRGNVSEQIEHLNRYGISTKFVLDQTDSSNLRQATGLVLRSNRDPGFITALKHFTDLITANVQNVKDQIYNDVGIFIKGDFAAAALLKPISRSSLDPLRSDILKTTGRYKENWKKLVNTMVVQAGSLCSGFFHYGGSPAWGVSFFEKGKRPAAIFTIGSEAIFIEFTLPLSSAEKLILNRHSYAKTVREKIKAFECVNCPKDCGGKELVLTDGVTLCKGRAEARRIYMYLKEPDEYSSIHTMIDTITTH